MRPAHRTKVCELCALGRQRLVVKFLAFSGSNPRLNWSSQRNSNRAFDSALSAILRAGMAFREISGVSGELVCDHAFFDILFIGRPRCSFGVT